MTPEHTADESPFVTIWESPRATIRRIVDTDPRRAVNAIFFVAGAVGALDGFGQWASNFELPLLAVVPGCLALGALNVPLGHANAWYKGWVGRLLGGRATRPEVVAVGAWSTIPVVTSHAVLWAIRLALYGTEVFAAEQPTIDAAPRWLRLSFTIAGAVFTLWSVTVSVVGFAEVNRFSLVRSIATTLLATLIAVVSLLVLVVAMLAAYGLRG
jgi:hypothetical protein